MGDIAPAPVRISLHQPYVVTRRRGDGFPHRSTLHSSCRATNPF